MIDEHQSLIRVHSDESGYFFLSYGMADNCINDKVNIELIAINPYDLRAIGELLIKASENYEKQTSN